MRVMFDANVVLDVLQQREPHQIHSAQLLSRGAGSILPLIPSLPHIENYAHE